MSRERLGDSMLIIVVDGHRYKNDPQIKAMTDLVDAYQRREVHSAEKILKGSYSIAAKYNSIT